MGGFLTGLLRFASLRAAFGRLFAFGYLRFASVPFGRPWVAANLTWRRCLQSLRLVCRGAGFGSAKK